MRKEMEANINSEGKCKSQDLSHENCLLWEIHSKILHSPRLGLSNGAPTSLKKKITPISHDTIKFLSIR